MDALALLCNLHADGPLTLQRLRRTGLESVEALLSAQPAELLRVFDGDASALTRFLREARLFAAREEDDGESAIELAPDTDDPVDDEEADQDDWDEELDDDEEEDEDYEVFEVEGGQLDRVLEHWRQLDRRAPPSAPAPRADADETAVPRVALRSLSSSEFSPEQVEALGRAGVSTLEDLARAQPLELAARLGSSWTRVRRLQFLARRQSEARREGASHGADAAPRPAPEVPETDPGRTSGRGPHDSGSIEAAGPFA